jgi:hypothetical protein
MHEAVENIYVLDAPQLHLLRLANSCRGRWHRYLHRWVQGGPYGRSSTTPRTP